MENETLVTTTKLDRVDAKTAKMSMEHLFDIPKLGM